MSAPEIGEIPVHVLPDGGYFISDFDLQECGPEAIAFVKRFSDCWTRDDERQGYITPPFKELPS